MKLFAVTIDILMRMALFAAVLTAIVHSSRTDRRTARAMARKPRS